MSKQVTNNNGNGEEPLNNSILISQLKAAIIQQSFPMEMSKKKQGCLEFAVRGGQLGINYIYDERDLSPNNLEQGVQEEGKTLPSVGMKRTGLKTLLMILESALRETDVIDHATVLVYYSVDDNGEYASGKLSIRRGIHHPRY